eukprot:CAMPEP_0181359520 /NCGR_PEP_ID=MMETSP1106-20121128/6136_1 /TAXON_ID=81844 /ORGANISM="Mantoniella antarctica, Strain SL-175" /LENGTH=157 /DNA_ID=CAMNT_0023472651 /DNA_START=8 /DNA_END=481 /DNA_ORIENTATION=+
MASVTARLPCVLASSTRARAPRSGRSAPTSAPTSGARHAALPLSFSAANARRGVRCNLSMDEGDDTTSKTLSSLDALLQGSQDEPEYDGPDTENDQANKDGERKPGQVSEEMKKKLLGESVGLGGLPGAPMPSNLFLNIILGISALAITLKVAGILG